MEPSSNAASTGTPGPAQLVLTASIARRYYVDGRSKVEIAEEFRLSRFKVARLLDQARNSGMVRIEISHPGTIDLDLSARLREALGLRRAIVVDTPEVDPAALRLQLGKAAADLLTEIVTAEDVLGLAWARAVTAMTEQLTSLARVPVVQLTGALTRPDIEANSVELVRNVARLSGGPAYLFYAPLVVPDASTARALRQQPEVADAIGHFDSVTKAVVGLGSWANGQSTLFDAMDEQACEQLRRRGVVAEISGVFVNAAGEPVRTPVTERVIAINAAQMDAIDEVVAIPYGVAKVEAVLAAVRGGLVNGLVTHTPLATALLDEIA
ncbi:transcriptional regulator [Kribbella amoyensis]|uniref:Transcriptional regulator n=1 Tax=Kribbella amoyensis TaxID=996641 RepID=A0A561BSW1_9ACTN|nr:sugar-binding domain-containing protein [Kribbella amoyensis]TWD81946.1 transcriptional regulator [Kribbella amoyensis]